MQLLPASAELRRVRRPRLWVQANNTRNGTGSLGAAAFRAVGHGFKAFLILAGGVLRAQCLRRGGDDLVRPVRQVWMQAVINPLAAAFVLQNFAGSQLSEMAGYFRLDLVDSMGEFTHTQFAMLFDQGDAAQSSVIGEIFAKC